MSISRVLVKLLCMLKMNYSLVIKKNETSTFTDTGQSLRYIVRKGEKMRG